MLPALACQAGLLLVPNDAWRQIASLLVGIVLESLLSFTLAGAITYGVFQEIQGRRASLGETMGAGVARAGRVIAASLLMCLVMMAGFCAAVVPAFYVMAALWIVVPVVVVENRTANASLGRSRRLTTGNLWRIFGIALVMIVLHVGASHAVGRVLGNFGLELDGSLNSTASLVHQLVTTFVLLPLTSLQPISQVVVYHDLRVGREGADVEELVKVFE
jgi:hypothetical protein